MSVGQAPAGLERMLGALLRIGFQAINARIVAALERGGYHDLRPSHFSVFQHLDADGTRVTSLADRGQMTKQAMGELVMELERRGYLQRAADPSDRRAKLVMRTDRGWEVEAIARATVRTVEEDWARAVGADQFEELKKTLEQIVAFETQSDDRE